MGVKESAVDLFSGSAGGTAVVLVGQPMDTIKVKMQTFGHMYSGIWDCFLRTVKTDGVARGLYAGTTPALVAYISENSVLFAALGLTQKLVARVNGVAKVEDLSLLQSATAGSCASIFSATVLCPTELVKCRLQAAKELSSASAAQSGTKTKVVGATTMISSILKNEGPRGMFRGLVPTWCRELPGYFFFFLGYETSKTLLALNGQRSKDDLTSLETMFCGGMAGVCFWSCIFPLDVIKSRIQVRGISGNVLTVGTSILRTEGVTAFYRGLTPALVRTFPANAGLFLAYEYTRKMLTSICL
eukprot:TRINITY_DN33387_c0_g1_i1.p1 TRINITY_DN33387_c0_g1~~TRINITY_DN33387_c0_g1_i1.p1  ORF type:complete len:316 (-),score=70.65 TRINITY_DN33387_c0_g1_i1:69-971(-)